MASTNNSFYPKPMLSSEISGTSVADSVKGPGLRFSCWGLIHGFPYYSPLLHPQGSPLTSLTKSTIELESKGGTGDGCVNNCPRTRSALNAPQHAAACLVSFWLRVPKDSPALQ